MDLKIKTATLRYQHGANTRHSYVTMGTFVKEVLGSHAVCTYDPSSRRLTVRAASPADRDGKPISPYNNQKFPWRTDGPSEAPISGGIDLAASYHEDSKTFSAVLPADLPVARAHKPRAARKPLDEAQPISAVRKEVAVNTALKDKALKARTDLVTALGKLNGTLYAVDKATGQEVQIVPSSLRMVAKMTVVKVEEVEL